MADLENGEKIKKLLGDSMKVGNSLAEDLSDSQSETMTGVKLTLAKGGNMITVTPGSASTQKQKSIVTFSNDEIPLAVMMGLVTNVLFANQEGFIDVEIEDFQAASKGFPARVAEGIQRVMLGLGLDLPN